MSVVMVGLKKFIPALFVALLMMSAAVFAADDGEVRVGLRDGGITSAALTGESGLEFSDAATGEALYTAAPGETVSVSLSGGGFAAEGRFAASGKELAVRSEGPIAYDGQRYRGRFLLKNGGGKMSVINIIHMDEYLYSVLGKEMSDSFPMEALKAQAICAKNFVWGEEGRHGGDFDVCATTHCQVYSGVSGESEATRTAVDAVSGKAAYYDGEIVPLYFFATSGGATESVENVWGYAAPYLRSVPDPDEPADKASRYTWTVELTAGEIKEKLASAGVDIGDITAVTVDETTPSGRALSLTFTGTNGTHTVRKSACRSILGFNSQWFTVDGGSVMIAVGGAVQGGSVLTGSGLARLDGRSVLTSGGVVAFSGGSGDYTFNGRGYGHGVGMSQWGAYGMAMAGYDYEEILEHYFTGIYIR